MSDRIRFIEIGRAAWGVALLVAPRTVLVDVNHAEPDHRALVVSRILGGRHLVQAALSGIRPTRAVLATGVAVDGIHAATAVGLAILDRPRARAALIDAAVAAVWATFGAHDVFVDD